MRQKPNDEKLRELILYVATLSQFDPKFGAIKLNKLLFYADFLAYQRFGSPITGQEYQALPQGPAPKRLKPVMARMEGRDLKVESRKVGKFRQIRAVPIRTADLRLFSGSEIDLVHQVVERFRDMNATEISEESHLFLGWRLAKEKEIIPYSTVLIGTRKPTEREQRKGRALQKFAREALTGSHR